MVFGLVMMILEKRKIIFLISTNSDGINWVGENCRIEEMW